MIRLASHRQPVNPHLRWPHLNVEGIPDAMKALPQWVAWRIEERDGKPTKAPLDVRTGRHASSTNPKTWTTCEEVLSFHDEHRPFGESECAGIGFVFAKDGDIVGVDLDHCRDPQTGVIEPWAQAIIDALDSYTEVSQSGTGVHIILLAEKPGTACRTGKIPGFEMYSSKRYFCVTGRRVPGTPATINKRQAQLTAIYEDVFNKSTPQAKVKTNGKANGKKFTPNPKLSKAWTYRVKSEPKLKHWDRIKSTYNSQSDRDYHAARVCLTYEISYEDWVAVVTDDRARRTAKPGKLNRPDYLSRTWARAEEDLKSEPQPEYQRTEGGNAQRLVDGFGEDLRFCAKRTAWTAWTGKLWVWDSENVVVDCATRVVRSLYDEVGKQDDKDDRDEAAKFARSSDRAPHVRGIIYLAKGDSRLWIEPDAFDADRWLFNTQNCTIDLRTGERRPHNRADLITKIAPVEYDKDAKCPIFQKVLNRIFCGDREFIRFMRAWFGYAATGSTREQTALIVCGRGGNAKTTLWDAVHNALGDYAATAPADLMTMTAGERHPCEYADLQGCRSMVAQETERGAKLRSQFIKTIAGETVLKGRPMHGKWFSFRNTVKLVLITNNKPSVKDTTPGLWRKLLLVPFEETIPKSDQDRELPAKLKAERAGILAWIVRGCLDWQKNGLCPPQIVLDATNRYRAHEDPIGVFIEERCVVAAEHKASRSDLYEAYERWAGNKAEKSNLKATMFYIKLRQSGFEDHRWKPPRCRTPVRGFRGLALEGGK